MRFFIYTLVFACMGASAMAQLAEEVSFSEKQFDFGTVKEEDGPIIHEFKFINNGSEPVKVVGVKASCGCTTPAWSKEEVAPGESGFVQAQYNPRNRPGIFNKSLTVTFENQEQPLKLYIRGNVTPKVKSIDEELPTLLGGVRVKYKSMNMGRVYTTKDPTIKAFEVYNDTDSAIHFLNEKTEAPGHITLNFDPVILEPKTTGTMEIVYDGKQKDDLGFMSDNVTFYTNQEEDVEKKSITVFATILEYFPPMTKEDLEKAPALKVESTEHDFGKINKDESVKTTFKLVNRGQSPLSIRKTKSNCGCTVVGVSEETIDPGKSTEMEVTFNSAGRRGNQQKAVTIYSNDPRNPVQRVTVKAYVNE